MVEDKVSARLIKRNIKKHVKGEVCKESVLYIQDYITNILQDICISLDDEYIEYNYMKDRYKLPRVKRLNIYIVKKAVQKLFKEIGHSNVGDVGETNSNTTFSESRPEVA